jgi:hypothetical protein
MKTTEWFPATVQPVRSGWYEVTTPASANQGDVFRMYFTDGGWSWLIGSPQHQFKDSEMCWRGLVSQPLLNLSHQAAEDARTYRVRYALNRMQAAFNDLRDELETE